MPDWRSLRIILILLFERPRSQFIYDRFQASITALAMRLTRSGLNAHAAQQQALGRLYAVVQSQAAVLSYVDMHWLLAMGSVIMFVASFLLEKK